MVFKTISKSLVDYLKMLIVSGKLKPGQKINENSLAEELNISRHPLREAFRILEGQHLLFSIPRRGVWVREISMDDLRMLYQAREMIECYAIEIFKDKNIRDIAGVNMDNLLELSKEVPDLEKPENMMTLIKGHSEFHRKLVEATDNWWIIQFYNLVSPNMARYLYLHLYIPNVTKVSHGEHQKIVDFIKEGSFDKARESMRIHIRNSYSRVKKVISAQLDVSQINSADGLHVKK